ncbi:MAG: class I SAM-dependent methyltransferase [Planctomycetes bacterium]|nr:class I SAM-dependent methyltransferase [Planctomycetota bacterium]
MRALLLFGVLAAACSTSGSDPSPAVETSVRPGINADFTDANLDVDAMVKRFEAESREIFARRAAIARAVGLRPGNAVADVGAGTGVMVDFFARDVGTEGRVYAVEIAPRFVEALRQRAQQRRLPQVQAVLCSERDTGLAEASVDVVFVCDTYHHFEYPKSTLASIHRALRPGGELVVVDFERIPGTSRQWILDHVRAGKDEVTAEITAAGFEFVTEVDVGLQENFFRRFKKR